MSARVRCPNPECGAVFHLPIGRLGRNVYCLECGRRMTAKPYEVDELLEQKARTASEGRGADVRRFPYVAVLDNIRSLWNVGSIFRTADLCGASQLLLAGITGCPPRREISKTALGADEAVAWSYFAETAAAVEHAVAEGYTPVALESSANAVPIAEVEWPERPCLVVGNEVVGVRSPYLSACELCVGIPMHGVKNSFNVAVAFGIAAARLAEVMVGRVR